MSENKENQSGKKPGLRWVFPFFLLMGILSVLALCIPLRPTRSMVEKRQLKQFPDFSWQALSSGSYFDDISAWYSDTFPGRESWIRISKGIESLHGRSAITIQGDLPVSDEIPEIPEPVAPEEPEEIPGEMTTAATEATEATELPTEETHWGGVEIPENEQIQLGAVIQIGDTAFNYQGFSQRESDHYAGTLQKFADRMAKRNTRVISAPAPTSVGIMIEEQYLEEMRCASQDKMIRYMHGSMGEKVIPVDTYAALVHHNDEYIYFRTDHHWTALGAYYAYRAICESVDKVPAELEDFEVWDQGEFSGSLAYQCARPLQLRNDVVYAYIPQGDITHMVYDNSDFGTQRPLLQDMRERELNTKYLTFIWSDNPLSIITNDSIRDDSSCVLVKDSFGNCLAPFLTQNYHKVYVVDYRKFHQMKLDALVEKYDIQDVIFAPYVTATQSIQGNEMFKNLCNVY